MKNLVLSLTTSAVLITGQVSLAQSNLKVSNTEEDQCSAFQAMTSEELNKFERSNENSVDAENLRINGIAKIFSIQKQISERNTAIAKLNTELDSVIQRLQTAIVESFSSTLGFVAVSTYGKLPSHIVAEKLALTLAESMAKADQLTPELAREAASLLEANPSYLKEYPKSAEAITKFGYKINPVPRNFRSILKFPKVNMSMMAIFGAYGLWSGVQGMHLSIEEKRLLKNVSNLDSINKKDAQTMETLIQLFKPKCKAFTSGPGRTMDVN